MKFKLFFLSFLAFSCYADESVNDPEICNVVKKVSYIVMEARQQKVPSEDLQHIANSLEDRKAKQLSRFNYFCLLNRSIQDQLL